MQKKMKFLGLVFFVLFSFTVSAEDIVLSSDFDNLEVTVHNLPGSEFSKHKDNRGDLTLIISPKAGEYRLYLSLYPRKNNLFKIEDYKSMAQKTGEKLLDRAEESRIILKEIKDQSGLRGFYYLVTDKAPEKDGYKYLIQGLIKYNFMICQFTFMTNDENPEELWKSLSVESVVTNRPKLTETKSFEKIKIRQEDVPQLSLEFLKHFYSRQQQIFYNNPDLYRSILPPITEKYTQSYCSESEEGTIFFYCFSENIEDLTGFLEGLFYGEEGAGREHPEKIIVKGNYLIVFSYPYQSKIVGQLYLLVEKGFK